MVEIIPKPPEKIPLWQNLILFISLAILIIAILAYFGLGFWQKKADQKIKELDGKIAAFKTKERLDLESDLKKTKKKIDDFNFLFERHKISSNFFQFLEKVSHPKIQFSDFKLDLKDGKIDLSGQTESFVTLGQQAIIFQQASEKAKEILGQEILKTDLSKFSIGKEGKIDFTFNLSFGPKVFR